MRFSSNNKFSFKTNRKFEFRNFILESDILIDEFFVINKFELINFFPNIKKNFHLSNHKLSIKYLEDDLYIDGKGDILIQDNKDTFKYSINKKNDILDFKTSLKINNNPLKIKSLNYEDVNALIQLEGSKNKKNEIKIKDFFINEKENRIRAQNIKLNKNLEIVKLGNVSLKYTDQEKNVLEKIKSWADELVDLSGRNDLISFRQTKTTSYIPSDEIVESLLNGDSISVADLMALEAEGNIKGSVKEAIDNYEQYGIYLTDKGIDF